MASDGAVLRCMGRTSQAQAAATRSMPTQNNVDSKTGLKSICNKKPFIADNLPCMSYRY